MLQKAAVSSALWDFVALTKPAIVSLLLVTAVGAMFLASGGPPPLPLALAVVVGGSLAAGGANALNHYLDRDIDSIMTRTRRRPIPDRRVSPQQALAFGVILNVVGFLVLSMGANPLSAILALSATLHYVFIYTIWLKRSSMQGVVIGGVAGAVPPLVGWAAVTGGIGLPAVYLSAIVFFWTPPHFWALSLLLKDDYARAQLPMLPVVASVEETKRVIVLSALTLVAVTTLFFTTKAVGWLYFVMAMALGAGFLILAVRSLLADGIKGAKAVYLYSLAYLAALFAAIVVGSVLR